MSRAYLARIQGSFGVSQVTEAFDWLDWQRIVPQDARVFVKPNLTWPEHIPGVTTTPAAIEAVVAALRERTSHISVGESDGGYHSFQAEEAFRGHGLYELRERYGADIVNLSRELEEEVQLTVSGSTVSVSLPRRLLHETDVFVTLPVPKVHVMTGVSLSFKNQWGCIPSTMRLRQHPEFDRKIVAINRLLQPKLVVFDGTYFLDRTGPLSGDAVPMNLLIAVDGVGAADVLLCRLMGVDPFSISHLRVARESGMLPDSVAEIATNTEPEQFASRRFTMNRAMIDYLSLLGFRRRGFGWLFWESPLARLFHDVLYSARRISLVRRLLYGAEGVPPEWKATASQ